MAEGTFTVAILDEGGVLQGFETVTDELTWSLPTETRHPVPNGCDLAPKRYRRVMNPKNGKYVFEPIVHAKDFGVENDAAEHAFPRGALARVTLALATRQKPSDADVGLLIAYCTTFDGAV